MKSYNLCLSKNSHFCAAEERGGKFLDVLESVSLRVCTFKIINFIKFYVESVRLQDRNLTFTAKLNLLTCLDCGRCNLKLKLNRK